MSQMVKAMCAECGGHVSLKGPGITCRPTPGEQTGTYEFTCPECGQLSVNFMGPEVRRLLKLADGVTWVYLEERHDGPMLTHDDLLVFVMELWTASDDEILARAKFKDGAK